MKARIIFPNGNYTGNLLWNKLEADTKKDLINQSLTNIQSRHYWASPYPEGDGVTFSDTENRTENDILMDFNDCFKWLEIAVGKTKNSDFELAELEPDSKILCTVIVPLTKLKIEESFAIGSFIFVCNKKFDSNPFERIGDFDCEYLEFQTELLYQDLLLAKKSIGHNDIIINKCLALAENAMDLIRFYLSSFLKPHFTPNPAGQLIDGFYSVEIIPEVVTHIKPLSLSGISKPFSVSNNWLGPEVEAAVKNEQGVDYLIEILNGRDDELALKVKSTFRACRQSFYAIGDESKFLNLVFALDGLVSPGKWTGWKHRTYISALLSGNKCSNFKLILKKYDGLYEARNQLVHGGVDFYELDCNPAESCQFVFNYITSVISLIGVSNFLKTSDLKTHATQLLQQSGFKNAYTEVINEVSSLRGRKPQIPSW